VIAGFHACDFGTDLFSRIVLDTAAEDGIDPVAFRALDRPAPMVSAAFSDARDRGFITYRGTDVVPPDLDLIARLRPRWLLQSFRYTSEWLRFIWAAKDSGIAIFGDCNGDDVTLDCAGVREFIGLCDVFSPNETEALRLTGAGSVDAALERLAELVSVVLIKRGANGGAGSVAITLLSGLGYRVIASTGRLDEAAYLRALGAADVIDRHTLSEAGAPIAKERWAGAIDSVGSHTLANVLAQTRYRGVVAAFGLAQGADLPASVLPFILRNVTLAGIDSVNAPQPVRLQAWSRLASDLDLGKLARTTKVIGLAGVPEISSQVLAGKVQGRTIVDVNA